MTMTLMGVLPVSGINLGLALAPPVLQAEITQLSLDISKLGIALAGQASAALNKPDVSVFEATLAKFPPAIADMLDPTKILSAGADLNADLAIQLGLINVALEPVLALALKLEAGLSVGGLAAWSYSGPASGLAALAPAAMAGSYQVGMMVATESPDSWGQFSVSVNTGNSKNAVTGGPPSLTFLGNLNGGQINTGLLEINEIIKLFKLKLQGLKAQIELGLNLSIGVNLPDPSALLAIANELIQDALHLFDNLVNVSLDLQASIGWLQLRLDYLLSLTMSIGAQLSAGGLALWTYSGSDLGGDVASTIAGGVPGGGGPENDIRALVIGCATPSAYAPFGVLLGGV